MSWAFLGEDEQIMYALPASLQLTQRHVGGEARVRFVRGYGSEDWFVTRDGLREAANVTIVGLLQTDRDEAGTQALISELVSAASEARYLGHLDASGVVVEVLPLLGALPITTEPDGVDGSMVVVTLPLVPGGEWTEFIPPPAPDEYTYEVFTESGVWDWVAAGQPSEVDVLVVAGGGGGGAAGGTGLNAPGGGGAGGVAIQARVAVTGNVAVTVGDGGAGGAGDSGASRGQSGQPSSFGAVTAQGGGGGGGGVGADNTSDGLPGGSGGGGKGGTTGGDSAAGAGASTQGHAGGAGQGAASAVNRAGGGGGGAGSPGSPGSTGTGGSGGLGFTLADLGWSHATAVGAPLAIAGGGGGAGGTASGSATHGGGAGNTDADGEPGSPHTGGGGGGGRGASGRAGGDGGSGLVIVRWRQDG